MFKNLKNVLDSVKEKLNHYFSDLSDKEEKFSKVEEKEPVIKNKSWSNICKKSRLDNIHIAAR